MIHGERPAHLRTPTATEWAFIALLVIGAGLRFFQPPLLTVWSDEAWSARLAQQPLADIIRSTAADKHPPLYYLLLHIWIAGWGYNELSLRLFSAVSGVVAVPLAFLVATQLTGTRLTALLTMAAVALSPLMISVSQEVRMYSLLGALALGATYLFLRFLANPGNRRLLGGYVLVGILILYTHYLGAFLLVAHFLWALQAKGARQPEVRLPLVISVLILAASLVPWASVLLVQTVGVEPSTKGIDGSRAVLEVVMNIFGFATWGPSLGMLGQTLRGLASGLLTPRPDLVAGLTVLLVVVLLVGYAAVLWIRGVLTKEPPAVVLGLFFGVPLVAIVAMYLIGAGERPGYYIAFVVPFYYMILSLGIQRFATPVKGLCVAAWVGAQVMGLTAYYTTPPTIDWRAMASLVDAESGDRDAILFSPWHEELPFDFYSRSGAQRFGFSGPAARAETYVNGEDPTAALQQWGLESGLCAATFRRLHFVGHAGEPYNQESSELRKMLDTALRKTDERRFGDGLIVVYQAGATHEAAPLGDSHLCETNTRR